MTLRSLEIYNEVCLQGTISAASRVLHLSQPAVSLAIKELESYYDISLFYRVNRKMVMTYAGEVLFSYTSDILKSLDTVYSEFENRKQLTNLSIGCNVSFGETYLMDFICYMKDTTPEAKIQQFIGSSHDIITKLKRNEIDIAITDDFEADLQFQVEPFFSEQMVVICNSNYTKKNTISLKELSTSNLLLREKGSATRAVIEQAFLKEHLFIRPILESTSIAPLIQGAILGLGYAIVPLKSIENTTNIKTLTLSNANLKRNYSLIYPFNKVSLNSTLILSNRLKTFMNS